MIRLSIFLLIILGMTFINNSSTLINTTNISYAQEEESQNENKTEVEDEEGNIEIIEETETNREYSNWEH